MTENVLDAEWHSSENNYCYRIFAVQRGEGACLPRTQKFVK